MCYAKIMQIWPFVAILMLFAACTEKPRIIEQKCSSCHSSSYVYKEKRPADEWCRLLFAMKARGLKVTPDEGKAIQEILSKNYTLDPGKGMPCPIFKSSSFQSAL